MTAKAKKDPLAADLELSDQLSAKAREVAAAVEGDGRVLQAVEEAALAGEEDLVAVAVAQPTKQDLAIAATGIDWARRQLKDKIIQAAGLAGAPKVPRTPDRIESRASETSRTP